MSGKGCKPHWEVGEDEQRLLGGEGLATEIPGKIEFQEEGKNDLGAGACFLFQKHSSECHWKEVSQGRVSGG